MNPKRSYDWKDLDRVVSKYKESWVGFDPQAIVEDNKNILLTDGEGNYGLFEYDSPGVYYGHYMFTVRGIDKTYDVARTILGFFFREFPAFTVLGLTPVEHKGALKLNKKLGFRFNDLIDTEAGPHYQVSLNKEDFQHG